MLVLTVVVTLLAASSITGAGPAAVTATLLGLAVGTAARRPLEQPGSSRHLSSGKIWLRGEWLSLVQIGVVLVVRYATNAVGAMNPLLHANPIWHLGTLFVCSLLSGIFLGRTVRRVRPILLPRQQRCFILLSGKGARVPKLILP